MCTQKTKLTATSILTQTTFVLFAQSLSRLNFRGNQDSLIFCYIFLLFFSILILNSSTCVVPDIALSACPVLVIYWVPRQVEKLINNDNGLAWKNTTTVFLLLYYYLENIKKAKKMFENCILLFLFQHYPEV